MCLECEVSAVAKRKSTSANDAPAAPCASHVVPSLPFHSSRETKHLQSSAITSSSTASSEGVVTMRAAGSYSSIHLPSSSSTVAGSISSHNSNNVWSPNPPFDDGDEVTFSGG